MTLILIALGAPGRWAPGVALLFAGASIAWPYAKIGMEATLTLAFAVFLLGVVRVRTGDQAGWVVTGAAAGAAFAIKPYAAPVLLPALILLTPAFSALDRRKRIRAAVALVVPLSVWIAAFGWYNLSRHGSLLDIGNNPYVPTLAAPFNALGFLVSPGKGLFFYSPLVVLGLLGLVRLLRFDRRLALTLLAMPLLGVVMVAGSSHWTDETWGPRYIVYVAWLPLLGMPLWCTNLARARITVAVALLAVAVQLVGVVAPYETHANSFERLTGLPRLVDYAERGPAGETEIPLGRDPTRWVPQLSPLVVQAAVVGSWASERVGGPPITYRYRPYEGLPRVLSLRDGARTLDVALPDVWWASTARSTVDVLIAAALLLMAFGAAVAAMRPTRPELKP